MKNITLENADLVADLFEETWTEEGAIVIYPYQYNKIVMLTKEDLKNKDLVNEIYSNEDASLFDTSMFSEVVGFQNLLRDLFNQFIVITKSNINQFGNSIENAERLNRYTAIYKTIGGK